MLRRGEVDRARNAALRVADRRRRRDRAEEVLFLGVRMAAGADLNEPPADRLRVDDRVRVCATSSLVERIASTCSSGNQAIMASPGAVQ